MCFPFQTLGKGLFGAKFQVEDVCLIIEAGRGSGISETPGDVPHSTGDRSTVYSGVPLACMTLIGNQTMHRFGAHLGAPGRSESQVASNLILSDRDKSRRAALLGTQARQARQGLKSLHPINPSPARARRNNVRHRHLSRRMPWPCRGLVQGGCHRGLGSPDAALPSG